MSVCARARIYTEPKRPEENLKRYSLRSIYFRTESPLTQTSPRLSSSDSRDCPPPPPQLWVIHNHHHTDLFPGLILGLTFRSSCMHRKRLTNGAISSASWELSRLKDKGMKEASIPHTLLDLCPCFPCLGVIRHLSRETFPFWETSHPTIAEGQPEPGSRHPL